MTPAHSHRRTDIRIRRAVSRATLLIALAMPAAALAEVPVAEAPVETSAAIEAGPERDPLAKLSGPFSPALQAGVEERERPKPKPKPPGPFHPVEGEVDYGDVIAAFGNARGRPHEGQDIFAPAGTPVVAPSDGVVVDAGSDGGRGNWLAIHDRKRERTYSYFHMAGPAKPAVGDRVKAGERVGEVGCTGSCSGDHLHFEIREGEGPYGTAIDPMPIISKWDPVKK